MSIVSDVGHRELVSSRPNCRKMTDPMSTENDYQCSDCVADKIENGRNKHIVKCLFCPSHILNPGLGTYLKDKCELPKMTKKIPAGNGDNIENKGDTQCETLTCFWQVSDMYSFENIGFSNTVGEIKYLACADCEIGPVGYYNMNTKVSYVALARVCHVD